MSRPAVSIVLCSFQRAHLLRRSLHCYEHQDFPKEELEIVVVDDSSTDNTDRLVQEWSKESGIRAVVITPHPKYESWRDCGATINLGIRASTGNHCLLTHPEVMVGRRSVAECVKQLDEFEKLWGLWKKMAPNSVESERGGLRMVDGNHLPVGLYACCRIYYLSPRDQVLIDTVDWQGKGPLAVRDIEGFYDEDTNGNADYTHRATDIVAQPGSRMPTWESWVFGGMSRRAWKMMGGMLETQRWGSVDVGFIARRRTLGIPNHTCESSETICTHQNHDLPGNVSTPRDMEAWVRELQGTDLQTAYKLVYPHIDYL